MPENGWKPFEQWRASHAKDVRLSSLRSGPGWLRGMNGSITAHCAFESQNGSAITASVLLTVRENQEIRSKPKAWSGSDPWVGSRGQCPVSRNAAADHAIDWRIVKAAAGLPCHGGGSSAASPRSGIQAREASTQRLNIVQRAFERMLRFIRMLLTMISDLLAVAARVFSKHDRTVGPATSPPDNLFGELGRRRGFIRSELSARLYLYNQTLIVSSVAAIAEYGPVTTLPFDAPDHEIGRAVCTHLIGFTLDMPKDLRDQKSADWEAYRASKAKSVKQFRAGAWCVFINTERAALRFEARPYLAQGPSLHAGSEISLSASYAEIGAAVRRVLEGTAALHEHKLFDATE